jgi:hypothetical protein
MSNANNESNFTPEAPQDFAEALQGALTEWRARIDELMVQIDLANMEFRDELSKQLNAAENAGLAARAGLAYAGHDLASAVPAQRDAVTAVLHDLQRAFRGAREAFERR